MWERDIQEEWLYGQFVLYVLVASDRRTFKRNKIISVTCSAMTHLINCLHLSCSHHCNLRTHLQKTLERKLLISITLFHIVPITTYQMTQLDGLDDSLEGPNSWKPQRPWIRTRKFKLGYYLQGLVFASFIFSS